MHNITQIQGPYQQVTLEWEKKAVTNLADFDDVLTSLGICFWLDYGTLLGAVRDKKLVSEMKDIDVGLLDIDEQKLSEALDNLYNIGFRYCLRQFQIGRETYRTVKLNRFGIEIDMSIYKKRGNFALDLHSRYFNERAETVARFARWCYQQLPLSPPLRTQLALGHDAISRLFLIVDSFPRKSVLDLPSSVRYLLGWYMYEYAKIPLRFFAHHKSLTLYGRTFYVPNSTEEYLSFLYGSNWRTRDPSYRRFHATWLHFLVVRNSIETKCVIR
jgi:phosphorylcholine metabolism protein LicD